MDIKIFSNDIFGNIRVIEKDNQIWFVGKDIAEKLNYKEPNKAIVRHVDEDDRIKCPITDSSNRVQDSWIINESGMYSLVLSSKLESAKEFKRWVTNEVLPAIRKTGG